MLLLPTVVQPSLVLEQPIVPPSHRELVLRGKRLSISGWLDLIADSLGNDLRMLLLQTTVEIDIEGVIVRVMTHFHTISMYQTLTAVDTATITFTRVKTGINCNRIFVTVANLSILLHSPVNQPTILIRPPLLLMKIYAGTATR